MKSARRIFTYRRFLAFDTLLAPLGRDEVGRILAEADLGKYPENALAIVAKLIQPDKLKGNLDATLPHPEFFMAGLNWRVQAERHTEVCDGESEFHYSEPNHQLDVYARGTSRIAHLSIRDFRIYFDPGSLTLFDEETLAEGRIRLHKQGSDSQTEVILDADIGFVERSSSRRPVEDSDRFQFVPINFPGGIVMPAVKIEIRYRKGVLSSVDIIKVDKAEFNDGLPAGIFRHGRQGRDERISEHGLQRSRGIRRT